MICKVFEVIFFSLRQLFPFCPYFTDWLPYKLCNLQHFVQDFAEYEQNRAAQNEKIDQCTQGVGHEHEDAHLTAAHGHGLGE